MEKKLTDYMQKLVNEMYELPAQNRHKKDFIKKALYAIEFAHYTEEISEEVSETLSAIANNVFN